MCFLLVAWWLARACARDTGRLGDQMFFFHLVDARLHFRRPFGGIVRTHNNNNNNIIQWFLCVFGIFSILHIIIMCITY